LEGKKKITMAGGGAPEKKERKINILNDKKNQPKEKKEKNLTIHQTTLSKS
jgi:hypothetical protein